MYRAWDVCVEFDAPDLPDDVHDQVMDLLAAYHVAIASPEGVFAVFLTVEAPTVERALREVLTAAREAVFAACGSLPVSGIEVLPEGEREQRVLSAGLPDVAGRAEVAEILGVTPQRASQIMRTDRFRRAVGRVQQLANGPVVLADAVREYAETRSTAPGRPRKDAGSLGE